MSFFNWMSMNMIVDIAFLVFSGAVIWKLRKMQQKMIAVEEKILLVAKNPQKAKRMLLKEKR
tara:strand:+ start:840 stop:1025 length:186 start_codon:yes stop_codon:yes gene_type:complete